MDHPRYDYSILVDSDSESEEHELRIFPDVTKQHAHQTKHTKPVNKHITKTVVKPLTKPVSTPAEDVNIVKNFDVAHPDLLTTTGQHKLHVPYVLWYHSPNNRDYSIRGYNKFAECDTAEQVFSLFHELPTIFSGMYFFMKSGYYPIWEDAKIVDGHSWTIVVDQKCIDSAWFHIVMYLIGNTFCDRMDDIVGVSASPKRNNCTIRIWCKNPDYQTTDSFPSDIAGANFKKVRVFSHKKQSYEDQIDLQPGINERYGHNSGHRRASNSYRKSYRGYSSGERSYGGSRGRGYSSGERSYGGRGYSSGERSYGRSSGSVIRRAYRPSSD